MKSCKAEALPSALFHRVSVPYRETTATELLSSIVAEGRPYTDICMPGYFQQLYAIYSSWVGEETFRS